MRHGAGTTRSHIASVFAIIAIAACMFACSGDGRYAEHLEKGNDAAEKPAPASIPELNGEPTYPGSDAPVVLAVDFRRPIHRTGRLIGWNIGRGTLYATDGDPTHPEWRTAEMAEAIRRLSQVRPANGETPYMRFSGLQIDGTMGGDGYHFWDFVRPDRLVRSSDNMSTHQYHAVIDEAAAQGLVTLNFGSGTADEAASYVRHLNGGDAADPMVAARLAWGRVEPWGNKTFEIGNEIYGFWNTGYNDTGLFSYANPAALNGGDPDWYGLPASNPHLFTVRALEYIDAVLAVQPDARFWIPLSQATMDAWGGIDVSVPALADLLEHPAVEAAVIHQYQVDDAAELGFSDKNSLELLLAGSELFRPLYEDLRDRLDRLDRDERLKIVVTEYHVAGFFSKLRFARADQAVVGLGIADMLIAFSKWGVDGACQHMALNFGGDEEVLYETWYNPFRRSGKGALIDMPSYEVTRLAADHLLDRTVRVDSWQMRGRTYRDEDVSLSYPIVNATAFVDDWLRGGTMLLLNRSQDEETVVDIQITPGAVATGSSRYAPASLDMDAAERNIVISEGSYEQDGSRLTVALPPHSLTALRFDLRALR